MVVFSPHAFDETSVSEVASIFAVFHSRVFARDAVATNNVNIRSLIFFIGPPLRSICHSHPCPRASQKQNRGGRPPKAKRGSPPAEARPLAKWLAKLCEVMA